MRLAVEVLRGVVDPFRSVVWTMSMDRPITRREIRSALREGRLWPTPLGSDWTNPPTRDQHVQRVAHLVRHGWSEAIVIEALMGVWPITDGNHRLAAAIYRRDEDIEVEFCGFLDGIRDMFGEEVAREVDREWSLQGVDRAPETG